MSFLRLMRLRKKKNNFATDISAAIEN
jgi:hypothetical protein